MTKEAARLIEKLVGEPCTRREIGEMRSLSVGFGKEAESTRPRSRVYRAWELGTWTGAWRITRRGVVLLGSRDAADPKEAKLAIHSLELGNFVSLRQVGALDVRVELDNGVEIDFLTASSDDDEVFYLSCPDRIWVQFAPKQGWKVGPSDKSWSGSALDVA